jgi:hypothetical protein
LKVMMDLETGGPDPPRGRTPRRTGRTEPLSLLGFVFDGLFGLLELLAGLLGLFFHLLH